MPTPEAVACEQVVIAWSSLNLLGNSGMGPVAVSDGWTLSGSDPFAGLGEGGRYLTEDAFALVGPGRLQVQQNRQIRQQPAGGHFVDQAHVLFRKPQPGALIGQA